MKKYRAWALNEDKYIMIHLCEDLNQFLLKSPNIYSLMKYTEYIDCTGKEICEKDILDINGHKVIVCINNDVLEILYSNGKTESLDRYKAEMSRVIGNIFENPMVAF